MLFLGIENEKYHDIYYKMSFRVTDSEVVVDIFKVISGDIIFYHKTVLLTVSDRRAKPEYTIKHNLQMAETELEAELEAENHQIFYSTLGKTEGSECKEKSRYE